MFTNAFNIVTCTYYVNPLSSDFMILHKVNNIVYLLIYSGNSKCVMVDFNLHAKEKILLVN